MNCEEPDIIFDDPEEASTEADTKIVELDYIFTEIQQLYITVKASSNHTCNLGDRESAHYCPVIAKKIVELTKYLPLWTGIMVPVFGYGHKTETSAASESTTFNDIKNRIFRHENLPIRVDKFIENHIACNLGQEILQKKKLLQTAADMPMTQDVDVQLPSVTEDEFSEEKWLPPKKRKSKQTDTYLKKDTSFRHIGMNSKSKCPVIGILKNGNVSELHAINVEN